MNNKRHSTDIRGHLCVHSIQDCLILDKSRFLSDREVARRSNLDTSAMVRTLSRHTWQRDRQLGPSLADIWHSLFVPALMFEQLPAVCWSSNENPINLCQSWSHLARHSAPTRHIPRPGPGGAQCTHFYQVRVKIPYQFPTRVFRPQKSNPNCGPRI